MTSNFLVNVVPFVRNEANPPPVFERRHSEADAWRSVVCVFCSPFSHDCDGVDFCSDAQAIDGLLVSFGDDPNSSSRLLLVLIELMTP